MTTPDHVARILSSRVLPRSPEVRLQDAIAAALADHVVRFVREVRLSPEDIIDFLVEDGLGVEVKIDGSVSDVTRQLHRYAQSDRVTDLLLVTTRSRHRAMPAAFAGKPIRVLNLIGGAF